METNVLNIQTHKEDLSFCLDYRWLVTSGKCPWLFYDCGNYNLLNYATEHVLFCVTISALSIYPVSPIFCLNKDLFKTVPTLSEHCRL